MALFLQHVIDAITYGSQFALYALGIALIFGIMGLINFAHGELIMVGAYTILLIGQPALAGRRRRDHRRGDRLRARPWSGSRSGRSAARIRRPC